MSTSLTPIVAELAYELTPQDTGETARINPLPDIKAVLFDIYGTLIISGTGDISIASSNSKDEALITAWAAMGIPLGEKTNAAEMLQDYLTFIKQQQSERKEAGAPYPEVEIRDIWKNCLDKWQKEEAIPTREFDDAFIEKLSMQFEMRVNPVWTMPGAADALNNIRQRGCFTGIISNAQFYTPHLFPHLLGEDLDDLQVDPDLRFYSYAHGRGKPDTFLYHMAADRLRQRAIEPHQVLYIGNDMLNDMYPASVIGFRTALFAGDQRSLRLRSDDDRCSSLEPDCVITHCDQILSCLQS